VAQPTVREVKSGVVLYTAGTDEVEVNLTSIQAGDWIVVAHGIDYGSETQASAPTGSDDTLAWGQVLVTERAGNLSIKLWAAYCPTAGARSVKVAHTDQFADSELIALVVANGNRNWPFGDAWIQNGSHATAHVAPAATPSTAADVLLCGWISGINSGDTGNYAAPAGMTEQAEVDAAPYSTMSLATQALASTANTGTKTATFTRSTSPATATGYASFSVILTGETVGDTAVASPIAVSSTWAARKEVTRNVVSPVSVGSSRAQMKTVAKQVDSPIGVASFQAGVKDARALPAGGPIFMSLFLIDPDTGGYVALPDFTLLDVSPIASSVGTIRVSYPDTGLNFERLHELVTEDRDAEVSIWFGGRDDESAMRATLNSCRGDEVDEQSIWEFSGLMLEGRTDEAITWPADPVVRVETLTDPETGEVTTRETIVNPNRETIFENATAGAIVKQLVEAAHARGTITDIYVDSFTEHAGSNGKAFTTTATLKISPGTTIRRVLDQLANLGMCDFEVTRDHQLRIYDYGTRGRDLTAKYPPVVLRAGKDLTDSPRTYQAGDATFILGAGKDGIYEQVDDPVAEERRGKKIEKYTSQGSINDAGTLQAYLQAQLASDQTGKMELAHGLSFADGGPIPLADYGLFDWVYSDQGWGLERLRVRQWEIRQDEHGNLTGTVTLNDLTSEWEEAIARRLERIESGEIIVGAPAQESPPPANGYKRPKAPTGVVASSLSYQDLANGVDALQTYASVTAGWSDVVLNEDESALTVTPYYRVRYRYLDGPNTDVSTTLWPGGPNGWQKDLGDGNEWYAAAEGQGTQLSFSGLAPGRLIEVQAATVIPLDPPGPYEVDANNRAFRRTLLQSKWSIGFTLTTDTDTVAPLAPSIPVVTEYLGTVRISWDGKDHQGNSMVADFAKVEVHVGLESNFTPSADTYRDTLFGPSSTVVTNLLYNVGYFVRLVAYDIAGNVSAPSEQGAVITRQLLGDDIFEGAVGEAQLAYAAVTTAKIKNLAVNDAKIQNMSVGKLVTGLLTADMILGATIKTAETGARIEFDGVSFRQYNSAGQLRTQFVAANGSALITGLIRSAMTGERFELNPDGTLRLYPATGQNFAAMFNVGNELVFRGQLRTSDNSAAYVRLNANAVAIQYGKPDLSTVYSQLTVQQSNVDATAPVVGLRADHRYATADGLGQRISILHNDASGNDVAGSVFNFWYGSGYAMMETPGQNLRIVMDSGGSKDAFWFEYNDSNLADIHCGLVNSVVVSTEEAKTAIEDPNFDPLALMRRAKARKFEYTEQRAPRAEKPGFKVRKRKAGTDPKSQNPKDFELVDAEWEARAPVTKRRKHIGPIAEDIEAIAPDLVTQSKTGEKVLALNDMIGMVWSAVDKLVEERDALVARVDALEAATKLPKKEK
jgi:hypothetical protein